MPSKSKAKGNTYEREIVDTLKDYGFTGVKRAWGSDGRSLGWSEKVDIIARKKGFYKIQCKRRRVIPKWLSLKSVDLVMTRADRGDTIVVLTLEKFMKIIGAEKNGS
jgi:Holliday junction resolvase